MVNEIFQLQNPWRKTGGFSYNLLPRHIFRTLWDNIDNELILGLVGSRQVGKSSLLYLTIGELLKRNIPVQNIFYFNLDDLKLQEVFSSLPNFISFIGNQQGPKYVLIDEIQRLSSPGLFLKEIFDLHLPVKILFSGSSQLEIHAKTREHLVGRSRVFEVQRLNFEEYIHFASPITRAEALDQIMLYGSYPAVAKAGNDFEKKLRIKDIFQSYIQKDLVDFLKINKLDVYNKLLIKLANQTGELLNIHSLSNALSASRSEIEKYIEILENTYICKRLYPFSRNYGKEIVKTPKIYFLDLGLRNFIINNFNLPEARTDTGKLFENFVLTEMLAADHYSMDKLNFWRTTNQTEIDFILQKENEIAACEVKWEGGRTPKAFENFKNLYPDIRTKVISKTDYLSPIL